MSPSKVVTRRAFVRSLLCGVAGSPIAARAWAGASGEHAGSGATALPTRVLGRTAFRVTAFGLGGQAALEDPSRRQEAVAIVQRALDLGVNYVDTAPGYGRGASEEAIGEALGRRRPDVFLASKTSDRSYDGSMRQLEGSLRRLRTDRLDLWQLHNVKTDGDLGFVFSREGAVRALEKAREQGIVRFVGITGHQDPAVLRRGIERYPFDTALLALNAADRHGASFVDNVLPTAVSRGLGIVAMKIPARGRLLRPDGVRSMRDAMGYVLTLPVSTAIVGVSSLGELEENVAIAREFKPFGPEKMAELERLTLAYHSEALWYRHGY